MVKVEFSLYLLSIIVLTIIYYILQKELIIPENQYSTEVPVGVELDYRRQVLLRACRVVGDLNEMAKNGTSFDDLIKIHRRVHNLTEKLWEPTNQCYEPIQLTGARFVIFEIFNRNNLTETRFV